MTEHERFDLLADAVAILASAIRDLPGPRPLKVNAALVLAINMARRAKDAGPRLAS